MAYTPIPTYVTNQLITAAHGNTYWKDNFAALFPHTTIGDIAYASASNVLSRLGIGSEGQSLTVSSGIPGWGGTIKDIDIVDVSPDQTFSSATWTDITGATLTLALPCTCTVFIFAVVAGYPVTTSAGYGFSIRGMIDGVADTTFNPFNGSANPQRNEALPYIWYAINVPAGNRIAKIQCASATVNRYVTNARLIALAFAE